MAKRTPFILALIGILSLIGATGWFLFGDVVHEHFRERSRRLSFDPVAWEGSKAITNDVRIRMVDDLMRRYSFRGMAREQVTAIVGEPDKTEYFKEWDMVYWLGPERGWLSIDSEWLVFRFDSQKKITEFRIVRDRKMQANTSLEPTADAVAVRGMTDSSITSAASLPRLSRLWLSSIR